MIMVHPYMPHYAKKVMSYFGKSMADSVTGQDSPKDGLDWSNLGCCEGLEKVSPPEIYFSTMDSKTIESYRARYAGSQKERAEDKGSTEAKSADKKKIEPKEPVKAKNPVEHFNKCIALKTAKIIKVEKHPEADKLYIETLDDGSGEERIILSGLVPYLTAEELLGKTVVIADNLKPRKMRGIESRGMLLAADYVDKDGKECVEVLDCPWAKPGTPVVLEGARVDAEKPVEIDADIFFVVDICVKDKVVGISGVPFVVDGRQITTVHTLNGGVH